MYTVANLGRVCDMLVEDGLMHPGQVKDVMVRYSIQEKRILIHKRNELRKKLGRQRIIYDVGEMEIIGSFKFPLPNREDELTEQIITECVARHLSLPFMLLDPLQLDYTLVTSTFQGAFAERHVVIPVAKHGKRLTIAVADPFDRQMIDSLAHFTGMEIDVVLSPKADLMRVIVEFHGFKKSVDLAAGNFSADLKDLGNLEAFSQMKAVDEIDASDKPIVQAVWFLFNYAFDQHASDIHIEPKRETSVVRLRIDGVMHRIHVMPKSVHRAVISRVKTLARMDIAESRRPQDGRIKTNFKEDEIELRVSTIPTAFGEKVVIRIFDPADPPAGRGRPRVLPPRAGALRVVRRPHQRPRPRDRPHRLRQDDHPLLDPAVPALAGREHRHDRGPRSRWSGRSSIRSRCTSASD